jgi:signal transduction histidine kinase/HPt (histidine-containing phosphotransfer) domain-containing protein
MSDSDDASALETKRISRLRAAQILDTKPEAEFDRLVLSAAALFQVPIAAITLVDQTRQWFKASVGLPFSETDRDVAFCSHTIRQPSPFVVNDATADPRFVDNPLVTESPKIQFYAGAPLVTRDGYALGSLCVMDHVSRSFSPTQLAALSALAQQTIQLLELRELNAQLTASNERITAQNVALERARAMVDASPDLLAVTDADGIIRELVYPKQFASVVPAQLLVGRPLRSLSSALPERLSECIRAAVHEKTTHQITFSMDRFSKQTVFETTVTPCRDGEALIVARDVTELAEIERMKHELVSMITHELRTPLSAVHGGLSILQSRALGELNDEQQELVAICMQSTERLSRLVNDVLDLDRLSRGLTDLKKTAHDPSELVQSAVREVAVLAEIAGVRVELELDTGYSVDVDRDRIVQALVNLLGNALRFSPRGSAVVVRVDASATMGVRVSVKDSGPGITAAAQTKLFRKFERGGPSAINSAASTGLGLAIAKAIVEQHGGTIGVESEVGHGATFFLELDARLPPMSQIQARWEREAIAEMRRDVRGAMHECAAELRVILQAVTDAVETAEQLEVARRLAHRFAGTAPTAGFVSAGVAARSLEDLLHERPTLQASERALLTERLQAFVAECERA